MKDPRMVLISFIVAFTGIEQGFFAGDFTRVCITETIGTEWIGWISCAFAATDAVASIIFGKMADKFGKKSIVIVGFIAHASFFIFLFVFLTYGPGVNYFVHNTWLLFLLAGVFGIGDAAWNTFGGIIIGFFFNEDTEAGFSNLKLFGSSGAVIMFVWGPHFYPKLYFTMSWLAFSMIALVFLNFWVHPLDVPNSSNYEEINSDNKKN